MTRTSSGPDAKLATRQARLPRAPTPHLTPYERAALGIAARAEVPPERHAEFGPPTDRPDPVGLLVSQGESRVPELVPIRFGRMLVSPFTFYRGAAAVMSSDLAVTPVSGLTVQLCGDAHLSNFGTFGSPERQLMFDINDFDETYPRTVGVGRQAPCRQLRCCRSGERVHPQAAA